MDRSGAIAACVVGHAITVEGAVMGVAVKESGRSRSDTQQMYLRFECQYDRAIDFRRDVE